MSQFIDSGLVRELRSDHHWMTKAAVEVLSSQEQRYLGDEIRPLVLFYCGFPDMHWSNCGEWGGWSGYPDSQRRHDLRREWDVSYYCRWNPVLEQGARYSHSAPDSYRACRDLFPAAIQALRNGQHADGIRFLGALSHYIEDSATFSRLHSLHRRSDVDVHLIDITGYRPQMLGNSVKEATANLVRRNRQLVKFIEDRSLAIRRGFKDNNPARYRELYLECDNEGAKVISDMLRTAIRLAPHKPTYQAPPVGQNLVPNPSFETNSGEDLPQGWYIFYHDLTDKLGRAEWEGKINRNRDVAHSGRYSAKMMWTPKKGIEWRQTWCSSLEVRPGQKYRCSCWAKTRKATGDSYLAIYFCRGDYQFMGTKKSRPLSGTTDWQKLSFDFTVPKGAKRILVACRSDDNRGAAYFDDLELIRLDARLARAKPKVDRFNDSLLILRFDESRYRQEDVGDPWFYYPTKAGYGLEDASIHRLLNFGLVCCSGSKPADLHVRDPELGWALQFDGKDDFVEIPRGLTFDRGDSLDILAAPRELTIMFWVKVGQYRDATRQDTYLISKEHRTGRRQYGYRMEMSADGKMTFSTFSQGRKVAVSAPYQTKKWFHIAATVDQQFTHRLYINGRCQDRAKGAGPISGSDRDLYLGADTGLEKFFKGRLSRVEMYRAALSQQEIRERSLRR